LDTSILADTLGIVNKSTDATACCGKGSPGRSSETICPDATYLQQKQVKLTIQPKGKEEHSPSIAGLFNGKTRSACQLTETKLEYR
jgi:hypothetical protein